MAHIHWLTPVLIVTYFVAFCRGSYVITTPREWLPGGDLQVCVQVQNPLAPAGKIDVTIDYPDKIRATSVQSFPPVEEAKALLEPTSITVPPGNQYLCENIALPEIPSNTRRYYKQELISISGSLDGSPVNHTGIMGRKYNQLKTVIQTDKYLYKPGQTVQFRILTHGGPLMEISTEPYSEIYITTPSNNRIAQWLKVNNSKGLIHLSMQLADEPEEGFYNIFVIRNGTNNFRESKSFKVEEYVLPRYEVTVKAPKYVLGTDKDFSFTTCAKYTFGEPVKGNITWTINNSQRRDCNFTVTRNDTISGCNEITVRSSEIKMTDCQVSYITATATVSEDDTGAEEKGDAGVSVSRNAVTFETLSQDDFLKPNLPYTLKVLAKLPDGSPASGELLEVCHGGSCQNMTTPADGILRVYLANGKSKRVVIQGLITRAVMQLSKFTTEVKKFFSPSNSSLLIHAPEESLECVAGNETNHVLPVLFSAVNQKSAVVNVQVMSRGQIQYWKSEEYRLSSSQLPIEEEFLLEPLMPSSPDIVTGVINIPLKLPITASPIVRVIVWYIKDDGEVVSDVKELEVEKCLPNNVDLSWSTNKTEPGSIASWKITSAPNSICSLGVVDKSVELLTPKNDALSVDSFFGNLYQYHLNIWPNQQVNDRIYCRKMLETEVNDDYRFDYYSDFVDTLHMFDKSGLYVFSDLTLETRPCKKGVFSGQTISTRFGVGGSGLIDVRISNSPAAPDSNFQNRIVGGFQGGAPSQETEDAPRTDFPETWLWDLTVVPSSGSVGEDLYVPDTITEWVGKAVCVHPQKGIGLSQRASLTTFTPFFIDLTLPPSIKRGEVLPVKISVFNYLQESLPVRITLEESSEYDFVGETSVEQPIGQRIACVGSQDKQVHTIKIQPKVIGEVNITVSAYVDPQNTHTCGSGSTTVNKRDALVRPITVEAEGFLREKSWSKYICADEIAAGEDSVEVTQLSVPSGMVEGSERAFVTAVGDLLAISLKNLGSLIRMPYGCGEQNMLNFAPNIFILQYLKATRQETPEATEKLLNFMRTGYQRQLLYRHDNGSYSAFGKADDSGSTWLSAFVLKSFSQAKEFILIDEAQTNVTRDWLISSYGVDDTCAVSVGKVFNKGMKGGLGGKNSSVPLTAYILISLLESGVNPSNSTIQRGLQCILEDTSTDSYTEALKAYALTLAKSPSASKKIEELLQRAIKTNNSTHWELPKGSANSKALEVETAGYAILAMMTYDSSAYKLQARKIVKWITSQRNGRGGFYSTQDTVVALQALASFASHTYQGDLNLVATLNTEGFSHSFQVKESNKLLQQQVSLPNLPANVSLNIEGQGCAVLQTVLRYNDPEADASDAFSLRVNTRTEPDKFCITKRISACASYLLPDGVSNMAVIEVNLISGYIPEKDDLKQLLKDNPGVIKRYDIDGSKLSFYIDEFTAEDVCVNFRVVRQVNVENTKPGSVIVYDYYQPEFLVSKTYNLPVASQCRYF